MSLYDNKTREFTIQEGCPWYQAQQSYGAPNVNWCEPTSCAWINEPANTWSNLGFLFVGLLIAKKLQSLAHRLFGWIVIVMGLLSAIYHATNNYLSQYFDFVGMALMTSYLLSFAAARVWTRHRVNFFAYYWFFFSANLLVLMCFDIMDLPIQLMLAISVVPILALDLTAGYKEGRLKEYGWFVAAVITLILAQISAQIDLKRVYCQPENVWLHGHVIWHLLCALGMGFAALHMDRLSRRKV